MFHKRICVAHPPTLACHRSDKRSVATCDGSANTFSTSRHRNKRLPCLPQVASKPSNGLGTGNITGSNFPGGKSLHANFAGSTFISRVVGPSKESFKSSASRRSRACSSPKFVCTSLSTWEMSPDMTAIHIPWATLCNNTYFLNKLQNLRWHCQE